jgi:DNA primase
MDVVALAQHGVENAVATLGTATTPMHVTKLLKMADNVVFCFDGDAAGRKAAWRALEVSLPVLTDGKVVSFLFLPAEDDPDTYVRRLGKEAFQESVAAAKPLSQFLFAELAGRSDMATEEGRARFLAQAKPLVAQIEAPALSAMLRRRLSELAQLGADEIERLVPSKAPERRPTRAPGRTVRKAMLSPELQLLGRILTRPDQVAYIPDDVLPGLGPEAAALKAVVEFFRRSPQNTLGQASAYFEGTEHATRITEALNEPLLKQAESPDFDLAVEVGDLVETLRKERLARRGAELLRLVESGQATTAQQAEYEQHWARLATANSGNPSPEERSKL